MTTHTGSWVGQKLAGGRYEVVALLGEGGMGLVYRAADRNLATDVVIKVPRRSMLEDPKFAGRFAREIRSLVQLSHPHIVKVIDVGEHDGQTFAVMQYLSGGTLRDRLNAAGDAAEPLRLEQLLDWLEDVAGALDFIHARGYVHRDVKPENILFDGSGHVYLSDFGIAKIMADSQTNLTGTGSVVGTPHYLSPEQLHEKPYDGRVDQYALAIVTFELLAGRRPFEGPSALVIALHMMQAAPPLHQFAAGVSPRLSAVVSRALEKNPDDRYPSCQAFAQALLAELRPGAVSDRILTVQRVPPGESAATALCPGCGKQLTVQSPASGQRVRCPHCQELFQPPRISRPAARPLPLVHAPTADTQLPTLPATRPIEPRPRSSGNWLAVASILLAIPALVLPLVIDPGWPQTLLSSCLPLTLGLPAALLAIIGLYAIRRDRGRKLARSGILFGLIAGIAGMLLGVGSYALEAIRVSKEKANDIIAQNNLRQIGIAFHSCHDATKQFPPADRNGLSWRVQILPYIEEELLYRQFKLDEPWDSPNNLPLVSRMPSIYRDPRLPADSSGKTFYRVLVGPGTLLGDRQGMTLEDVMDGSSNTLMVFEAAEPIIWTKPDGLLYDPQRPLPGFGNSGRGTFHALFADASVRTLSTKTNEKLLRAYITANGNEDLWLLER